MQQDKLTVKEVTISVLMSQVYLFIPAFNHNQAQHACAPMGPAKATGAPDEQKGPLCAQETFCAARPVSLGLHGYQ